MYSSQHKMIDVTDYREAYNISSYDMDCLRDNYFILKTEHIDYNYDLTEAVMDLYREHGEGYLDITNLSIDIEGNKLILRSISFWLGQEEKIEIGHVEGLFLVK